MTRKLTKWDPKQLRDVEVRLDGIEANAPLLGDEPSEPRNRRERRREQARKRKKKR